MHVPHDMTNQSDEFQFAEDVKRGFGSQVLTSTPVRKNVDVQPPVQDSIMEVDNSSVRIAYRKNRNVIIIESESSDEEPLRAVYCPVASSSSNDSAVMTKSSSALGAADRSRSMVDRGGGGTVEPHVSALSFRTLATRTSGLPSNSEQFDLSKQQFSMMRKSVTNVDDSDSENGDSSVSIYTVPESPVSSSTGIEKKGTASGDSVRVISSSSDDEGEAEILQVDNKQTQSYSCFANATVDKQAAPAESQGPKEKFDNLLKILNEDSGNGRLAIARSDKTLAPKDSAPSSTGIRSNASKPSLPLTNQKQSVRPGSSDIVSGGLDGESSIESQRCTLEAELKKMKNLVSIAEHLPDKGAKLRRTIIDLEEKIANLGTLAVKSKVNEEATKTKSHVQVKNALISQFEKALSVNPVKNSLYGGRMNEKRLDYAKAVTKESLVTLYSAITQRPQEEAETADPPGLLKPLMLHQRQALTWVSWRESQKPSGGILADDMGLGKTLTMIALMLHQRTQMKDMPETVFQKLTATENLIRSRATLIVCPTSIIKQWANEIKKFTGSKLLRIYLFHGTNREQSRQRLAIYDVVLTTYGTVSSEIGEIESKKGVISTATDEIRSRGGRCSVLLTIAWRRMILDEGHTIKNHNTKTAKACCRIPAQSRWVLTGTPVHNDLKDLYSLIKFIRCEPFDQIGLWRAMIENKSEQARQRLNTLVNSLILRRTKEDVSKVTGKPLVPLPPKKDEIVELTMSAEEQAIYNKLFLASKSFVQQYVKSQEERDNELSALATGRASHEQLGYRNPFNPGNRQKFEAATSLNVLVVILRLRQACVHFSLTKESIDIDALQQDTIKVGLEAQLRDLSIHEQEMFPVNPVGRLFEPSYESTKIKALMKRIDSICLEQCDPPSKIVIVSQWVKLLELIAIHLRQHRISYTSITGSLTVTERGERVERFNNLHSGPLVMLLSLSAGGVGLNLIGGNHLFVVDLHWNPALEKQACDRIYRVGQSRNVFIHKFVCKNTIETKVLELQNSKLALAKSVLTGAGMKGFNSLTIRDLTFLFSLGIPETFPKTIVP